jgi:serine/threonine protein kinase
MTHAPEWDRVKRVFQEALERPPEQRAAWLQAQCGDDRALAAEVESLLATHARAGSFAERPALELLGGLNERSDVIIAGVALQPGDRIGVYEIRELVGAGGMGEVYRAHDLRLRRDVAIKVLPSEFTDDRQRHARFEREARVLAALNHPNIAAIYGIEDVSHARALVLEFVEGETLAESWPAGSRR